MASSGLRIQYTQRPGVSEAAERTALANAYKFVIAARERKVAGSDGGADAGKEIYDSGEASIQQRD